LQGLERHALEQPDHPARLLELGARCRLRKWHLPHDLDYSEVRGLSIEVRQKLMRTAPDLGQASRVSGITPAAISLLLVHLKRRAKPRERSAA